MPTWSPMPTYDEEGAMTSVSELYGESRFGETEAGLEHSEPRPHGTEADSAAEADLQPAPMPVEARPDPARSVRFGDLDADSLVTSLAGLAERVEQNQAARRAAEAEAAELRAELERLGRQREHEAVAEAERVQELDRERERRQ